MKYCLIFRKSKSKNSIRNILHKTSIPRSASPVPRFSMKFNLDNLKTKCTNKEIQSEKESIY